MALQETAAAPATAEGGAGLRVDVEHHGAARVLVLEGPVDHHTVPRLREHLAAAVQDGDGAVVVDLTHVTFVDSSGLAALLNALRRLTRAHRRLLLSAAEGPVLRILRLTRLDSTFAVHATAADALHALASEPAAVAA